MKELEEKLNENQKISDEQKSKFLNSSNIETEKEEQQEDIQEMTVEEQKNRISEKVKNLPIVGIGDSVLLGAADELYKIFPNSYFDGKVSRTVEKGRELLQELKDQGKLGDVVVLVLANNGDYSDYKHEKLMEVLENREVFWIDSIGADDPNYNEQFENFAKNYPNIHIIKWTDIGEKHPEYFYADGVHIKEQYAIIYANMIYDEIYNYYWNQYNLEK